MAQNGYSGDAVTAASSSSNGGKVLWSGGPDQLIPTDSLTSSQLDKPVKLRFSEADVKKFPPISLYSVFKKTVDTRPDHDALVYRASAKDPWLKFSYLEYWKACHKAAKSFIKLGLGVSECVGIAGFNAPQWFMAQMGAIFAG